MYEILPHTADLRIRATGATLEELFLAMAMGMMSVVQPGFAEREPAPACQRTFTVTSLDHETLLIDFLSELLCSIDTHNEVYPDLRIVELGERRIVVAGTGAPVEGFAEDIKAVTYHDVAINRRPDGTYETTVVFDV